MSTKAERLGRGASFGGAERVSARRAAIAAATGAPTQGVEPRHLPLRLISLNPDNPREELRNIEEMAETFRSVGQITAITIGTREAYLKERPGRAEDLEPGTDYVVIDGNRRLSAARLLGWETMPKIVVDDDLITTDEQLLEAAFIANSQREDMTDLEEADALRKLVGYYGSQRKAAARLGISQGVISQRLSLLALAPDLQADLAAGRRKVEHVRGLAKLTAQEQREEADRRAATAGERDRSSAPAREEAPAEAAKEALKGTAERTRKGSSPETPLPAASPAPTAPGTPTPSTAPTAPTASAGVPASRRKPAAVPAQAAGSAPTHLLVPQEDGAPALSIPEVDWAVGDFSEALDTARDIARRFGPTDRRAIISFLLSVADEEKKLTRTREPH